MSDSSPQALIPLLSSVGPQILGTKQANLAFYTLFLYDSILTFPDEIEHIWKKRFSLVSVVYLINRYYALAVLTICIVANIFPIFTPEMLVLALATMILFVFITYVFRCQRFSPFFPYAGGTVLTIMPDIILALRVYALYEKKKIIGLLLTLYLTAELGVALWIYGTPGGHPLALPPPVANNLVFHLCIEETADSLGNLKAAVFQFMQTIYDTSVFSLIIYKAVMSYVRSPKNRESITTILAKHGISYYALLFSANFTWAMTILLAPVGLKYSPASPTLCMACTMVNRITLSLRSYTSKLNPTFNTQIALDGEWSLPPIMSSRESDTLANLSDSIDETEYSGSTLMWPNANRSGDYERNGVNIGSFPAPA